MILEVMNVVKEKSKRDPKKPLEGSIPLVSVPANELLTSCISHSSHLQLGAPASAVAGPAFALGGLSSHGHCFGLFQVLIRGAPKDHPC